MLTIHLICNLIDNIYHYEIYLLIIVDFCFQFKTFFKWQDNNSGSLVEHYDQIIYWHHSSALFLHHIQSDPVRMRATYAHRK